MKMLLISFLASLLWVSVPPPTSVYDFTMNDIDDSPVQLSKYKGKVLLIVNTASKCGLTPQYESLQATYEKYQDQGLVILGFPANNFMGQEPAKNSKIKEFCTRKFKVTFPMFSKISVKGKNMHPFYQYLTSKKQNGKVEAPVTWNFQKFLVDKNGKVIQSFAPNQKVTDANVIRAIEKQLKK
ncbi:glutathione peroxidase [Aureispira anguillae]|uniref:Glutathione peroxidase n=1 Tax=Aureispira anguillae TaxID=2864201 RepID=A0A915YH67_9BACT|nr:glutathione peroxidase [Aureispira anguillae]